MTGAGDLTSDRGRKRRDLLRPEDATSLDEFQARAAAEKVLLRAANSSWRQLGKITLSGMLGFAAIFFGAGSAFTHGAAGWVMLGIALVFAAAFFRVFGRVEKRGFRASRRYLQLDRMGGDWAARAERGEIPKTTPGGPKVWREDE